jgi:hypothetical protein
MTLRTDNVWFGLEDGNQECLHMVSGFGQHQEINECIMRPRAGQPILRVDGPVLF